MKVWHVGGPLHGLVQEYETITFNDTVKFALDIHKPILLMDPSPSDCVSQIRYEIQKFAVPETDAEVLRKENRKHHLNYFLEVYVDTRLDQTVAKQMLMELIMLDYMRMNGEKI